MLFLKAKIVFTPPLLGNVMGKEVWDGFGQGAKSLTGLPDFGNRIGCFLLLVKGCGLVPPGWVVGSILSFPKHCQAGAAQLWEHACLLVTPGQPVGGRLGWNASGIVIN